MKAALPPESNFLGLPREFSNPDAAKVVILCAPFERSSTFGRGSAGGPRAILAASREVELFDTALGREAYRAMNGIATFGPPEVFGEDGAAWARALQAEVAEWIGRGKFVAVLGGEHTSVVGAIQAHVEAYADLTVLQLDAHSDLRPTYHDDPWNHACAIARVLDFHDHVVQVGIRSQAVEERQISEDRRIAVFYAHDIHRHDRAGEDWIADVTAATRRRVYVTFDCDVFDPAVMPATGTPEPGGLTWEQINALLAALGREREIVGFDVNELAPIPGIHYPQFTAAKLVYRILAYRFP